jgi:hypothetical protein
MRRDDVPWAFPRGWWHETPLFLHDREARSYVFCLWAYRLADGQISLSKLERFLDGLLYIPRVSETTCQIQEARPDETPVMTHLAVKTLLVLLMIPLALISSSCRVDAAVVPQRRQAGPIAPKIMLISMV